MEKSAKFEIWVPTRFRLQYCDRMLASLRASGSQHISVCFIVDDGRRDERHSLIKMGANHDIKVKVLDNRQKSSLTKLWNQAIIECDTDWVFHSGDDSIFMSGWHESVHQIMQNNTSARMIHLLNYGGFAMHKSMVLKIGWFDERFLGGGYEDVDYQYRIAELDRYDLVDRSIDMKKIIHGRLSIKTDPRGQWDGLGNERWWMKKWSKKHETDFQSTNTRTANEIDWYPEITSEYSIRYGEPSNIDQINRKSRVAFSLK